MSNIALVNKEAAKRKYFSLSKAIQRSSCEETKAHLRIKRTHYYHIWKSY